MNDSWQDGIVYDRFMGRWSALVAREFLAWLAVPPERNWLDVGCGTGSLTRLIVETCRPAQVISIDPSEAFISYAQRSITDPPVHFRIGRGESLDLAEDSVDAVVSGLVLNFVPAPETALSEMLRVTRPGGTIGIFVWDYADGMQFLRYFWDAAVELDPKARAHDEDTRFPLCQDGALAALVRGAGLQQTEAAAIEVKTVFQNFDDYWEPFLGNVGPAPNYAMGLDSKDRQKLADHLRDSLPVDDNGAISLTARAWAVKGTA